MGGRPDIIPPEWASELTQLQACARRVAFAPQSESSCAAPPPCRRVHAPHARTLCMTAAPSPYPPRPCRHHPGRPARRWPRPRAPLGAPRVRRAPGRGLLRVRRRAARLRLGRAGARRDAAHAQCTCTCTCTCTRTRTCTCTCTCACAQVPVEYKTQLSSSMPPLTPKTPEGAAPKHAGGDGTGLYSTEGLYSTTAAAAAARLETQLSGGGLPPPAVAQGDPPAVAQDDASGV